MMLLRFLLACLLAAIAMPAAAVEPACHGGGAAMVDMMPGMDQPATDMPDRAPSHLCAGCVPVADWLGERVPARILPPTIGPVARIATFDPGSAAPPVLRPPRRG